MYQVYQISRISCQDTTEFSSLSLKTNVCISMNQVFCKILLPSIQAFLAHRIQNSILLQDEVLKKNSISAFSKLSSSPPNGLPTLASIALHRINDTAHIQYASAIALKLERLWKRSASEIAIDIIATIVANRVAMFTTSTIESSNENDSQLSKGRLYQRVWNELQEHSRVWANPTGWIYWQLSEHGLAAWLQILIEQPLWLGDRSELNLSFNNDNQFLRNSTNNFLFKLQYSHARCCSLLCSAAQEQLIGLNQLDSGFPWLNCCIIHPSPLPWLDSSGSLRLSHPAERNLIAQLLTTLDELSSFLQAEREGSILKLASDLSTSFQYFYSACRIWGEVKTTNLSLAQARLGLVRVTQAVLRLLLQDLLEVDAPVEL
jgi:Fe-S cluster biosynthesis and repair protein YggX